MALMNIGVSIEALVERICIIIVAVETIVLPPTETTDVWGCGGGS